MSFARIAIVGNLTRDPESRYLESGKLVLSFGIAANTRKGGQDIATFYDVSAFGEVAERLASMVERGYVAKGRMLYVEGSHTDRTYQGRDGQQRTSNDVVMTDWQFVGGGNQQDGDQQASSHQGDDSLDDSSVPF